MSKSARFQLPLRNVVRSSWVGLLLAVTTVSASLAILKTLGWLEPWELVIYDRLIQNQGSFRQNVQPGKPQEDNTPLLIVGIGKSDLDRYGWPLDDQTLAQALNQLQTHQPHAIGIDLYRDLEVPPGTPKLNQALQAPNIIGIEDVGAGIPGPPVLPPDQIGFNDLILDNDGVIRRALLFVETPEQNFYSFPLRLVSQYLDSETSDAPTPIIQAHPDRGLQIANRLLPHLSPQAGGYDRLDNAGYQILLNYVPQTRPLPTVSLGEILENQVDPQLIRNHIVLIGSVDPTLKDMFRTPYSSGKREGLLMPGVEIHAQIVHQLLATLLKNQPLLAYGSPLQEWLWLLLWIGLGAYWGQRIGRPLLSVLGLLLLELSLISTGMVLFYGYLWLPLVTPSLGLVGAWILLVGQRAYQFQRYQEMALRLLGQNTSPAVANALWEQRQSLLTSGELPGQNLMATVVFADLCHFSTTSETMEPDHLLSWLNELLNPVTELVHQYQGIINKFTGDGFMAVFGVPAPPQGSRVADDAHNAVISALHIALELGELNDRWRERGLPEAAMRIGICTGMVTAGSLGGRRRMEYGVLGDTVNTASRLESCQKERMDENYRILISETTYQHLDLGKLRSPGLERVVIVPWGALALKGKVEQVNVFQVACSIQEVDMEHTVVEISKHRPLQPASDYVLDRDDH